MSIVLYYGIVSSLSFRLKSPIYFSVLCLATGIIFVVMNPRVFNRLASLDSNDSCHTSAISILLILHLLRKVTFSSYVNYVLVSVTVSATYLLMQVTMSSIKSLEIASEFMIFA